MVPTSTEHGNSSHIEQCSSEDVIRLKNAMTVQAGNEIRIVCDSRIKLEHLGDRDCGCVQRDNSNPVTPHTLISATTPITLVAGDTPMRISPTKSLDSDFATGWRKLPDELRIEILKVNLVCDTLIPSDDGTSRKILRQHLALGPEISSLALQVFYEFNGIQLHLQNLSLPPETARPHIRKLYLGILKPYHTYWNGLRKVADGISGFDGVQYIEIGVELPDPMEDLLIFAPEEVEIDRPPVHFSYNGIITFWDGSAERASQDVRHEFERKVRGLITFGG